MPLCADDLILLFCEVRELAADGKLEFNTGLDNSGFEKGVSDLKSIANTALGQLTASLIQDISSAAAQIPQQIISVGSGFEASMSQVAATMGITSAADEFEMLSVAAKEMGESTKYSAAQASSALNYLALAGYDAEKSIAALPTVLNVAAAGGIELAAASDMITDAMSALGLETAQMSTFADQLAVTSQKSNTSVAQLGEAILTVGGTAKTLSGGVTEMNTALGILADNGIKGSEGGTMLRNVILSLSAPTDTAAAALSKLGVEAFDSSGNMKPLQETFADLGGALSQLTEQERTEALSNIFNKVDLKGVNALLGTSAERFDELSGYISDCSGAAAQMAETMDDNLAGDMTIMQSALEGLGIAAYEKFQEPMRTAVQEVTNSIGDLTSSLTDGKLSDSMDKVAEGFSSIVSSATQLLANDVLPALIDSFAWVIDNFDTIVTVAGAATAAVAAYTVATQGAAVATQLLSVAASLAANPLGLVAAAAAAATAAFVIYAQNKDWSVSISETVTAIDNETAALQKQRAEFNELKRSQSEKLAADTAQIDKSEALWKELKSYTDENGNVIKSNKRAIEIIGTLNEAYGLSIEYIDGQIQGYGELTTAMEGYFDSLRLQAKIDYLKPAYTEAAANEDALSERIENLKEQRDILLKEFTALNSAGKNDEAALKAEEWNSIKLQISEAEKQLADYQKTIEEFHGLSAEKIMPKNTGDSVKETIEDAGEAVTLTQEEVNEKLQTEWDRINHEYKTGVIKSEEALYARKSALLSQYGNADLKEHWKYYEELYSYQQDYSEKSQKEAEEAAEAAKKAAEDAVAAELANRQAEWENIDRLNTLGLMSDEDAIKARTDFVKKYYGDVDLTTGKGITDENYQYVKKVHEDDLEATKSTIKEQEKLVDDGLSAIVKRYQKAYDELEQKRKSYRDKLMSIGGDLFSVDEIENPDGSKTKQYTVKDIDTQLRKMREYNSAVKKLRAEGMSDALFSEMTSLGSEDSAQFAKYLSGMSAAEFAKINELYNEKQKLADELSNDLYKDEAQAISDSMTGALSELATSAYDYGAQTAQQFSAGFNEAMKELDISALYGQIQAVGANKNYENYKTTSDSSEGNLKISVDVTGKNSIYLDGKKVGEFNVEYQGEQERQKGA